jgi:hypothetical protein
LPKGRLPTLPNFYLFTNAKEAQMVRIIGEDPSEQKVIADIRQYGWHCVHIMAEGDDGPYAFTIGLFQNYQHPELIIFGLPAKVAHQILHIAIQAIQSGEPINLAAKTDALIDGYYCHFVEAPRSKYRDYVGFGRWYYEGDKFPLYQIVWPNRQGQFPWQPEASDSFKRLQPILGIPREAHPGRNMPA